MVLNVNFSDLHFKITGAKLLNVITINFLKNFPKFKIMRKKSFFSDTKISDKKWTFEISVTF